MHHTETRAVAADADRVWSLLIDVERWPTWTRSIQSLEIDGPVAVGAVATIKQPRLPVARWLVTEVEPGRSFTWESRAGGLHSVARHDVEPAAAGTSRLTLSIRQTGPLAGPISILLGRLTRRYVSMEAEGLAEIAAR